MSRIDMEELLDRYLKGEASPVEAEKIEGWLNTYQQSTSQWQQMDKAAKDNWLATVHRQIETETNTHSAHIISMWPRKGLVRILISIAAAILLFFTAYLLWPALHGGQQAGQLSATVVPSGGTKQLTLVDGSTIRINGSSELKYPKAFNGKTREVYLSGEAYFDIVHDVTKPFIIHTGKVITTVLGTAFNIKEDKLQHTVVVTVTRGKVSVANGSQMLGVITPNQQISFNQLSGEHSQTNVNAEQVIAGQGGDIHFNDVYFTDAVAQLQQRFKVKITFANNNFKNCRFTGTALKDEKLDDILKVICSFNDATYKTKPDGSIVIDGAGCE